MIEAVRARPEFRQIAAFPTRPSGKSFLVFGRTPPFEGWEAVSGIWGAEGPFPDRDMPVVRWGVGPATKIRVRIDEGRPARLVAIGRCWAKGQVLLARRFDAVGVDASGLALDYCARRGLRAVEGSLPDRVPLPPAEFGVVVASEVIEHVGDDRSALAAAARLLAPGGVLVCTVPAHQWLWSRHDTLNHHFRRYNRRRFAALFEGLGLDRVLLSYYQSALFPLVVLSRLAAGRCGTPGQGITAPAVRPLPRPLNAAFRVLFESEKHLLGHVRLPVGGSIISVHRRPE